MLADNIFDDGFHEAQLKVERCIHSLESQSQQGITYTLRQPRHESIEHQLELPVAEQFLKCLFHLASLIRPDLVELSHD